MTEKDLDYIIAVLKNEQTQIQPEWFSILGFLYSHKIAGLFYNRACKQDVLLPKKIENILKGTFEKQKRRNLFMRNEIKKVSEKLLFEGTKHMLLKGSVLSNISENDMAIYEDGERISNDIDILVKEEDISAVSKILYELGFVQGIYNSKERTINAFTRMEIVKRRMNRGEIAPFVKLTDNVEFPFIEIDVNFSLGNTPEYGKELLTKMMDSTRVYNGKIAMSVVEEELFFLHLIMHQYKESCLLFMVERAKDLDLYKLADIYYLMKTNTLDLKRLNELVIDYGLEQEFGTVLQQVGEVFIDDAILSLSRNYKANQPKVLDYEEKKFYEWQITLRERICNFTTKQYLKEVNLC